MYIVHVQPKNGSIRNPIHNMIDGHKALILMVEKGAVGFFDYLNEDDEWHTIATSRIVEIEEDGDDVKVETSHTDYLFEKIEDGAVV